MPLVRRPLARAAIVGGGAYAVGKRRAAAEQREADEQARLGELEQQQQAPAAAAPGGGSQTDVVAKLNQLKELRDSGALTPEEFEAAKQKLLQGQ